MEQETLQRKLTAILSADVKGYSRLMGEDEVGTVQTLKTYREVMASLITQHRGRVVDSPGDNLLAEFSSVVHAVECALEIQKQLEERNAELPENRKMEFRIGINLGDVIVEGERIYGDGVNIGARMEGLAEGGGICISGTVYDHIEGKLALKYEYLGEKAVKNIKKPVRVYRVLMEHDRTIPSVGRGFEMPDKPSIAVLPFVNISGDPEQEYFSDGITEDLITDLSKISGLFVIARNSVFVYKGKAAKVGEVGRELGVHYVLEGSVRRVGDRVRITAQLVDASTNYYLWAERYDRELKDIFSLQDEVTQKIVVALALTLAEGEKDRLASKCTDNVSAYDYFLRGLDYYNRPTKEANAQARDMFQKAIDQDPEYALAYAKSAWTHLTDWSMGWSRNPGSLEQAFELAQKAVSMDDSLPEAYGLLGYVYLWRKKHDQAIAELEKTIALDPNGADGYAGLGEMLIWVGRSEEGIELVKKGMRLNPHYPIWYLLPLGQAYAFTDRYEEAIEILERAVARNPDFLPPHILLALIYSETGRKEEGRAQVAEILRISPNYSLEMLRDTTPIKGQALLEKVSDALRKAGLK